MESIDTVFLDALAAENIAVYYKNVGDSSYRCNIRELPLTKKIPVTRMNETYTYLDWDSKNHLAKHMPILNTLASVIIISRDWDVNLFDIIHRHMKCNPVKIKESKKIANLIDLFQITPVYSSYDERLFDIIKTVSFSDLIELNLRFLKGDVSHIWYSSGQVADETVPLLDRLYRLNAAGFLSYNGQPYLDLVHENYKIKQRPYIGGYMEKMNQKFLDYLRHKNIIVFYTMPNKPTLSNFKNMIRSHTVTKEKEKNEPWESSTSIYPTNVNPSFFDIDILDDLVSVSIFTKYWKDVDLTTTVYDAMNHANL